VFRRNEDEPSPSGRQSRAPGIRGRSRRSAADATGRADGGADAQEAFIVEALTDLRDTVVGEVMTPRVDVVALSIPLTVDAVTQAVRESGHSCFPVCGESLDDLIGVLFVNDLFRAGWKVTGTEQAGGETAPAAAGTSSETPPAGPTPAGPSAPDPIDISRRLRQPFLVPESHLVLEVLAEMRRQRRAFAVVVDEHGGVEGVLTVKDLLGALVGDLPDEFDSDDEPDVVRVDGSRWLVDGRMNVDDVRDRLEINLPEGEYVTLGGFLFDGFGHIPAEGESLNVDGWELEVTEMDKHRIAKVVAKRLGPPASPPGGGPYGGDAGNQRTAVG
jgi:CBS domain containing-hemolysin-like protein